MSETARQLPPPFVQLNGPAWQKILQGHTVPKQPSYTSLDLTAIKHPQVNSEISPPFLFGIRHSY